VAADRVAEDQAVERRHAFEVGGADAEHGGDRRDGSVRNPAAVFLYHLQRFDAGGTRVGVMAHLVFDLAAFVGAQFERGGARIDDFQNGFGHRSTSDITKSMEAMYAIRSGTIWPRITLGICCRCAKLGVRSRVR
jgi:hypothetical protein